MSSKETGGKAQTRLGSQRLCVCQGEGQARSSAGVQQSPSRHPRRRESPLCSALPAFPRESHLGPIQICAELDHETLFTLTVTSRPFRNLLLSNFATKLWVDARAQAGLPELETDDLVRLHSKLPLASSTV